MIVALDLETTGLNSEEDKILEIALVKFDEKTFEIIDTFSSLVNPWIEIPELISNITNINQEDILDAPRWFELKNKVQDFIWESPILWHNIYFDKEFLLNNLIDIKNNIFIDTFLFANSLFLKSSSLNLWYVLDFFNIKLEWAHRALSDTKWSILLFEKLIDKLKNLDVKQKKLFKYFISKSDDSWFIYIYNNYLDQENISDIDSIDDEIVKIVSKNKIKKTKIFEDKDLDNKDIKNYLTKIDWLETRENQLEMLSYINNLFNDWWFSCIEAPTWLWKTFAYLLPSIIFSIKNKKQVFVSTTTKLLQDQIYFKDLEFLHKKLWLDFSYSKLKWKSNYIWISTFLDFIKEENVLTKEKLSFIIKIFLWLFETKHWELDELDYYWKEFWFLNKINSDSSITFSSSNPYEDLEFVVRARRIARKSNIVIINNNILFQDLDWDWNILWEVSNLIIDEVHNLEDVLTNSLKKSFCLADLEKTFLSMEKILKKYEKWNFYEKQKFDIIFHCESLFDIFWLYLSSKLNSDFKYKRNLLIKNDFFIEYQESINISEKLKENLEDIIDNLNNFDEVISLHLSKEIKFLEKILDIIVSIFSEDNRHKIIPIVSYDERFWYYLEYTILNPGNYLKEKLWSKLDIAILTSATLQVNSSFSYIKSMLSLDDFDFKEFKTDFDYKKQSLLYIPNDLWSIKWSFLKTWNFIKDFITNVWWNMLVLFTSFYLIKELYLFINSDLKKLWINIYSQWIMWWKYKLIDSFKKSPDNSILIWTDSFWEWIDIPWEDLKYLIIHKIPFMVPSDPIFQARSVIFKDSFNDYSIPKSVIKLKQWFWRLIRKKDDTGIVVFLDDRIIKSSWWKSFYWAFPNDINIKIWTSWNFLNLFNKK